MFYLVALVYRGILWLTCKKTLADPKTMLDSGQINLYRSTKHRLCIYFRACVYCDTFENNGRCRGSGFRFPTSVVRTCGNRNCLRIKKSVNVIERNLAGFVCCVFLFYRNLTKISSFVLVVFLKLNRF